MADLKRVPGCHVYWGTSPLGPGIAKLPKEKVIIFNVEGEAEADLKDVPAVKTPFDKERPVPLGTFDLIVQALVEEGDKTQCVFASTEELPATLGQPWLGWDCQVMTVNISRDGRGLLCQGCPDSQQDESSGRGGNHREGLDRGSR